MHLKQIRKNSELRADGKTLVFDDNGLCQVKKITKSIQSLIDSGYVKIEDSKDGKSTNS